MWAPEPLQVHLMLVYLLSVPDKLSDPAWTHGTLVYYAMMAVDYPRWPGHPRRSGPPRSSMR